jgi:hypothetical protein
VNHLDNCHTGDLQILVELLHRNSFRQDILLRQNADGIEAAVSKVEQLERGPMRNYITGKYRYADDLTTRPFPNLLAHSGQPLMYRSLFAAGWIQCGEPSSGMQGYGKCCRLNAPAAWSIGDFERTSSDVRIQGAKERELEKR